MSGKITINEQKVQRKSERKEHWKMEEENESPEQTTKLKRKLKSLPAKKSESSIETFPNSKSNKKESNSKFSNPMFPHTGSQLRENPKKNEQKRIIYSNFLLK